MRRLLRRGRAGDRPSYLLQGYIFVSSALLVVAVLLYTRHLITRMERQSDVTSKVFARFFASATFPATSDQSLTSLFNEVIGGMDFPVVITDARGIPLAWRGIGIDPRAIPYEVYRTADPANPPPGAMRRILEIAGEFDRKHEPIPMTRPGDPTVLGMFHYGESELVPELRWVPFIQLGTVAVLVFLGYLGYRSVKIGEQRSIWVGMAKETAHQLGTPISSLMGWMEVLKDKFAPEGVGGPAELPAGESPESALAILTEMERDVNRTAQVASRFETIGSAPRMTPDDVSRVAHETVEYFRRRWTRLGKDIAVRETYARTPMVYLNRDLLQWVFENLLRNSMDAMESSGGSIDICTTYRPEDGSVEVRFSDTGRGMTPPQLRRVFEPGFTTKSRGWGLGLALARRIVEEYHGGRIWARSAGPGRGATFYLTFPV